MIHSVQCLRRRGEGVQDGLADSSQPSAPSMADVEQSSPSAEFHALPHATLVEDLVDGIDGIRVGPGPAAANDDGIRVFPDISAS